MYFNLAFMRAKVQKKRLSPMNGGYSFSSKIKRSRFLCKGLLPETAPKTNTCMKTTTFYLVA